MPEDPEPSPSGPIRHDFDLRQPRPADKTRPGLAQALGGVLGISLALSLLLSAAFWQLCVDPSEWMINYFFNQPLGYVEPFEAYSQIGRGERSDSEEPESEKTMELTAKPSEIWDQWVLEEYLVKTGNENPYAVFPMPGSPEDLAKRRAAFDRFDKVMETRRASIEASVNLRVFLFDTAVYFLIFAAIGSAFVILFRLQGVTV